MDMIKLLITQITTEHAIEMYKQQSESEWLQLIDFSFLLL